MFCRKDSSSEDILVIAEKMLENILYRSDLVVQECFGDFTFRSWGLRGQVPRRCRRERLDGFGSREGVGESRDWQYGNAPDYLVW